MKGYLRYRMIISVNRHLHECVEGGTYYKHDDKLADGKFCMDHFNCGYYEECKTKWVIEPICFPE